MSQKASIIFTKLNKPDESRKIFTLSNQIIPAVFLTIGFCGLIFGITGYDAVHVLDVTASVFIMGTFLIFLNHMSAAGRRIISAFYLVFILLMDFIFKNQFINESKYFWNQISKMLGKTFGRNYPIYEVANDQWKISGFVITLILVLMTIFYFIAVNENIFASVLMIFCAILLQGVFGGGKQIFFGIIFILGNLMIIRKKSLTADCVVEQKMIFQTVIGFIVLIIMIGFAGAKFSLGNSRGIKYFHKNLQAVIDTIRYENKGNTALEITMSQPESYYLKGFVGSRLGDYGWESSDNSKLYEYADLFYWLHKEKFYGINQLAGASDIFNEDMKNVNEIHIKNIGASTEYIYVPYEYLEDTENLMDQNQIGDESVKAKGIKGQEEYSFRSVSNQVSKYPEILKNINTVATDAAEKYILQEGFYNEYVYEMYTLIDEENTAILENHIDSYTKGTDMHLSYKTAKENILNFLSENIKYVEETKIKVTGQSFLKDFLEVNCEGDSDCYATATVLMFRYYGIPARYVEGYLVTPDDIQGVGSNETIEIPFSNAHSWAEYYQDGVGWIPFETAPPYLEVMDRAEDLYTAPSGNSGKTEQTAEEIIEDNYEESQPQSMKDKKIKVSGKIIWMLVILAVVVLAVIFILRCILIKKKRKEVFGSFDNNAAIRALFSYTMNLLFTFKIEDKNKFLMEYAKEIEAYEEENWSVTYQRAVEIYRKARYSRMQCTEAERENICKYMVNMKARIYESLNVRQKLKWRILVL